eukprot:CAMPEP_0119294448 /NCGR_PEP_ID=MMETSP1329-20130426/48018_1 /TAXON_ID=114041 /ORGANISM="Genus nov. species nov., Strain RCC1024" /LENGTH=50 /DNA_ID=CAMNT_0007295341 /DNA_START=20 /DNA_END=168 /DNA_ORIENTATION=+
MTLHEAPGGVGLFWWAVPLDARRGPIRCVSFLRSGKPGERGGPPRDARRG